MIRVQQLSVRKQGKTLVKEVSLQIPAGKITVIVGKNGAGKSTILKALSGNGFLSPGTVWMESKDVSKMSLQELSRRRAFLAQQFKPGFPLKVKELVAMGLYVAKRRTSRVQVEYQVREALDYVDMLPFSNRIFQSLSGGEQKRVLLAKCIVQLWCGQRSHGESSYLFLDEPAASLDIEQQFNLVVLLQELARSYGTGICAVVHDLNLAARLADQIAILREGALLTCGSPSQVLRTEIIRRAFDVNSMIHKHPTLDFPQVTILPSFESAPLSSVI